MNAQHSTDSNKIVSSLMNFYEQFNHERLESLDTLYTQDVEFRDPVHTMYGILSLKAYMKKLATDLSFYRIRYTDMLAAENQAYLTWEMDYAHPKVNGGEVITVRGMSHIKYTTRIFYHEDSYEMGALLYEKLPVIGSITTFLKQRLGKQE